MIEKIIKRLKDKQFKGYIWIDEDSVIYQIRGHYVHRYYRLYEDGNWQQVSDKATKGLKQMVIND